MARHRKTRGVTALEELYRENEDDSVTEIASDTGRWRIARKRRVYSSSNNRRPSPQTRRLLVRRLATPTLRINLRTIIQEFFEARDLPKDLDIRDEFVGNKMSKQKRCNLCPSSLDRKTFYECLRCDKAICKEYVTTTCCECAKNV